MDDMAYYYKFKQDLITQGIEVRINKYGFFTVIEGYANFGGLLSSETIGLCHILGYDIIKLGENNYRVIKKLGAFSMRELEEEYEEELLDEIDND